ncbi:MAG TPA: BamA/TamA family outer membrane protein [Gammaproteobacteria bacterium]|jgi:translocation and assembly module TamA|nr:BamA/TamA family outer membrane protein [Gammaproteobacteria bacterium]
MYKYRQIIKKILPILIISAAGLLQPAFADSHTHLKFEIRGIKNIMGQNVISRLKIERKDYPLIMSPQQVVNFSRKTLKGVNEAVMPFGYYHAQADSVVSQVKEGWKITYFVTAGAPVRVTKVDITVTGAGSDNMKIKKHIKEFPLKPGDIFNSIIYTSGRDKLFDVINNQGYIKASASESKVFVNTNLNTAVIVLHLNVNERYYFGKINFTGSEDAYSQEFMQRFYHFNDNTPFSSNKLLEYQQDMNSSRYFNQVLIIPDFDAAVDNRIPLQASVVPVKERRYSFGVGYGTFTGPRLSAGVNLRRLTKTGHSFDGLLKLSSVLSGLALKYSIPGYDPLTEQWVLGANYQKFEPKNGKSYSQSLLFGYTKKLHHWTFAANMNYLHERYRVNNDPSRDSELLYPNLNLSYLKTDNIVQPTYGRSLNLALQGASSELFSTTSFLQGEAKGKLFMTPFSFAHVILRGDIGYTVVHDLTDLPLSMRYFAGGMTTIRGYPDSSIGPGKYLTVASAEYRNHLIYDLSGAVFYDVGAASDHFNTPLYKGAGVGLIYESIVGPIKLYAARGLSKKGHPWQIEFSMGPEF